MFTTYLNPPWILILVVSGSSLYLDPRCKSQFGQQKFGPFPYLWRMKMHIKEWLRGWTTKANLNIKGCLSPFVKTERGLWEAGGGNWSPPHLGRRRLSRITPVASQLPISPHTFLCSYTTHAMHKTQSIERKKECSWSSTPPIPQKPKASAPAKKIKKKTSGQGSIEDTHSLE